MLDFRTTVTAAIVVIASVLGASGQTKTPAPKAPIAAPTLAPPSPVPATQARPRVVVVEPIRIYDPLFDYPFLYTYPPEYMNENFGYVKIDTKERDASLYVDGGFADKLEKARKFALKPGTHDIELRDSDGRVIYQQRVAVLLGKTTTLHVG